MRTQTFSLLTIAFLLLTGFSQMAENNQAGDSGLSPMGEKMNLVQTRLNERLDAVGESKNTRVQNTHGYKVQAYVDGLHGAGDLVDGELGEQIRAVAKTMNGTVNAMTQSEEKVQSRNVFMKALFGYNKAAVTDTENQMVQTREQIQELKQLSNGVSDEAVKDMIQFQIRDMESNMEMLQTGLEEAKQSRGLFGFLFGK
ncbi:MAG: hypothetical protein GOU98_02880 [Candidatus Altiarchaeota archaeon]|nr:hypothetical protein [Candidatus Altiarchaeota archaeon]